MPKAFAHQCTAIFFVQSIISYYFKASTYLFLADHNMATAAAASPGPKKTIVVSGDMTTQQLNSGQQFVVTQSKGTTIIQPANQQYIVTGK